MSEKNIFGKDKKKPDDKENSKGKKVTADRGAADDWEALAMVINDRPGLKSRVLHKIRAMRDEKDNRGVKKQSRQEILEQRRKEQGGK